MKVFVEYNEPIGPISGFGLGDGTPGGLIIEKRVFLIFFSCGASLAQPDMFWRTNHAKPDPKIDAGDASLLMGSIN